MRSALLLFITVVISFTSEAQKKSFTNYYFEAKKLADSLKTYQILIQAHGYTWPFVSNDYVKNEVAKSFNFLNTKKPVDTNPDFVIKIILTDVSTDVDYMYKGKGGLNDEVYEVTSIYDVSFALAFVANQKDSVSVQLCTKKHYETKHNYSRKNPDFDPNLRKYFLPTPDNSKPIGQYVEDYKERLKSSAFIYEFNEVLVKFRKKK